MADVEGLLSIHHLARLVRAVRDARQRPEWAETWQGNGELVAALLEIAGALDAAVSRGAEPADVVERLGRHWAEGRKSPAGWALSWEGVVETPDPVEGRSLRLRTLARRPQRTPETFVPHLVAYALEDDDEVERHGLGLAFSGRVRGQPARTDAFLVAMPPETRALVPSEWDMVVALSRVMGRASSDQKNLLSAVLSSADWVKARLCASGDPDLVQAIDDLASAAESLGLSSHGVHVVSFMSTDWLDKRSG